MAASPSFDDINSEIRNNLKNQGFHESEYGSSLDYDGPHIQEDRKEQIQASMARIRNIYEPTLKHL